MLIINDVQVENILHSDKGHFVLCDFGSGRRMNDFKELINSSSNYFSNSKSPESRETWNSNSR